MLIVGVKPSQMLPFLGSQQDYMSIGAAHLNRLNHSMYAVMSWPGSTLSTIAMLNLAQVWFCCYLVVPMVEVET